jgi:hypothetical protein
VKLQGTGVRGRGWGVALNLCTKVEKAIGRSGRIKERNTIKTRGLSSSHTFKVKIHILSSSSLHLRA